MLKRLALSMVTVLVTAAPLYAGGPELKTDDDKTLYALGLAMSRNLATFTLTPAELDLGDPKYLHIFKCAECTRDLRELRRVRRARLELERDSSSRSPRGAQKKNRNSGRHFQGAGKAVLSTLRSLARWMRALFR